MPSIIGLSNTQFWVVCCCKNKLYLMEVMQLIVKAMKILDKIVKQNNFYGCAIEKSLVLYCCYIPRLPISVDNLGDTTVWMDEQTLISL